MESRKVVQATKKADLQRVNFKIKVLVLNKTVDALCKHTFQVTLTRATTGISCHHS